MTYLQIVNKVLRRLRESEVSSIAENPYSLLIGDLVNVVKREVEDSWNWDALRTTLSVATTNGLFNYALTNSGTRFRVLDIFNQTSQIVMQPRSTHWFDIQFLTGSTQHAIPAFYNFNGVNTNGDSQIDIYPIPNGAFDIRINIHLPQVDLVLENDIIAVSDRLVIEGVLARAISERGEDGGYQEQEARYNRMQSDLIAIESGRRTDETTWYAY